MRFRTFFWCVSWGVALVLVAGLLTLRSYRVFTEEELVALVRCDAAPRGAHYSFILTAVQVTNGTSGPSEKYLMQGDQWSMGGEILKWHPWLNLLGLRSCHKLSRLSSRYFKAQDEQAKPRSVYPLNGGTSAAWAALVRFQNWLPFVEAVYGNAAYIPAQPSTQWGVYVTLSGYLIKSHK